MRLTPYRSTSESQVCHQVGVEVPAPPDIAPPSVVDLSEGEERFGRVGHWEKVN